MGDAGVVVADCTSEGCDGVGGVCPCGGGLVFFGALIFAAKFRGSRTSGFLGPFVTTTSSLAGSAAGLGLRSLLSVDFLFEAALVFAICETQY